MMSITAAPLDAESWAPFGWLPVPDTAPADGADTLHFEWGDPHLNVIAHAAEEVEHTDRGLVCAGFYRHATHTQALMPINCDAVVAVAPPGTDFSAPGAVDAIRAFRVSPLDVFVLERATWHWGPFPLGAEPRPAAERAGSSLRRGQRARGPCRAERHGDGGGQPVTDVQDHNREVLDAVRVRRDAMYDTTMALERALASPTTGRPDDWCALVRNRVGNVRSVLETHVAETEADGGFFDDVRERAPQLMHAARQLQAEHAPLLAATDELDRALDAATEAGDVAAVRAAGLDLIHRILEHRHRGAELVYDAYSVDISAAD